ncbi:uncharacterized protein LOC143258047 [Tachypleus tridentatus]|uniref:uncharacterized protein LOC143258047 n=1 Tax=Tachypleus tridentatus TaxID=6853 RepID=UPI003FCFC684
MSKESLEKESADDTHLENAHAIYLPRLQLNGSKVYIMDRSEKSDLWRVRVSYSCGVRELVFSSLCIVYHLSSSEIFHAGFHFNEWIIFRCYCEAQSFIVSLH